MTHRIVITTRARADAVEAFRWIAEKSPDAAVRGSAGLRKAITKLNTLQPSLAAVRATCLPGSSAKGYNDRRGLYIRVHARVLGGCADSPDTIAAA